MGRELLIAAIVLVVIILAGAGIFQSSADTLLSAFTSKKGPLEKVTFIHYKKGLEKATCGNGLCEPGEKASCPQECGGAVEAEAKPVGKPGGGAACYAFLSKGAKWKTPEQYLINPANADGVSEAAVQTAVDSGVAEWEKYGGSIFGPGAIDYTAQYDSSKTDGKNTLSFGTYPDSSVIAVTTVWGYFSGPPSVRELVEHDMLFNELYAWGDAPSNPALMDLQNIATHELGHSAGMADLYTSSCAEETMYGYSREGETKKRDLNAGDIAGIRALYGS